MMITGALDIHRLTQRWHYSRIGLDKLRKLRDIPIGKLTPEYLRMLIEVVKSFWGGLLGLQCI